VIIIYRLDAPKSILETEEKKTIENLSSGQIYKKTKKNQKKQKNPKKPLGWVFKKKNPGFFQPCLQLCDGELGPRVVHVGKDAALQQVRAQVAAACAHPHARQHNVLSAKNKYFKGTVS
jgi:hypothetical protein